MHTFEFDCNWGEQMKGLNIALWIWGIQIKWKHL